MNCYELLQYLSEYIDRELDNALTQDVRDHLAACPDCHVVLDTTERTIQMYREHGQSQRISLERQARLFDRLATAFKEERERKAPKT